MHVDRVFLGGGGHDALVTLWIPLGAVRRVDGPIMVARGSHRSKEFKNFRETYGRSNVGADGANSGWATDDASALPGLLRKTNGRGNGSAKGNGSSPDVDWRTADFDPGDVVALRAHWGRPSSAWRATITGFVAGRTSACSLI